MAAPSINLAYPSSYGPGNPYVEPRHWRNVVDFLGPLELVTAPQGAVATIDQVMAWCNVDFDDPTGFVFPLLLSAATRLAEKTIDGQRQFLTATYQVPVRCWWHGELQLPRPPLQTVDSVKYYATDGTLTTLSSSNYYVSTPLNGPGRIERAVNVIWPTLQCDRRYPIVIQFTCGYGAAEDVPPEAIQATCMIAAQNNRYRGDDDETGKTSSMEIPAAALNLLRSLSWGSVF